MNLLSKAFGLLLFSSRLKSWNLWQHITIQGCDANAHAPQLSNGTIKAHGGTEKVVTANGQPANSK